MARRQYEGFPGVTVLMEQDFGAQPGDLNPLGYKDSIGQPAIEGSGVDPLPGQGPAVKAGESILGYPGQAGELLPMPSPDVLGAMARSPGCASTSPASGRSTASCASMPRRSRNENCSRRSWWGAGAAARR
jgi:hypothetical protein